MFGSHNEIPEKEKEDKKKTEKRERRSSEPSPPAPNPKIGWVDYLYSMIL